MPKLWPALRELHRSERELVRALDGLGARHRADHEIAHTSIDLARWSREHIALINAIGEDRGIAVRSHRHVATALGASAQKWLSDRISHRPDPALVLIADLRRLHLLAAGVSLDWELMAQGAQAAKDTDLLDVAKRCHPQALRQMRWANAMLKQLCAQALAG